MSATDNRFYREPNPIRDQEQTDAMPGPDEDRDWSAFTKVFEARHGFVPSDSDQRAQESFYWFMAGTASNHASVA